MTHEPQKQIITIVLIVNLGNIKEEFYTLFKYLLFEVEVFALM